VQEYLLYCGIIATIWIVIGVTIAGRLYPNYNHIEQFCSELGASGAPTEKLSPLINNYPLGLLFCVFGMAIISEFSESALLLWVGIMVFIHGVGTWVAGDFPMDADPYTQTPTLNCKVHSWAGFFMLLSLLIAPLLMVFHRNTDVIPSMFTWFSLLCFIFSMYSLYVFKIAFKKRSKLGLYQRISYGIQLFWLCGLSYVLIN